MSYCHSYKNDIINIRLQRASISKVFLPDIRNKLQIEEPLLQGFNFLGEIKRSTLKRWFVILLVALPQNVGKVVGTYQ